jgi:uncharacterized membrane protein
VVILKPFVPLLHPEIIVGVGIIGVVVEMIGVIGLITGGTYT